MLKSAGNVKNLSVAAAGDIMSPAPGESLLLSLCDAQPSAIWIHNSLLLFALHCSSTILHKRAFNGSAPKAGLHLALK